MPTKEAVIGAFVGGALGIVGTVGFGLFKYYKIDLPTLQQIQTSAANDQAARLRVEAREAKQREQLEALQKQSDDVKKQFAIAKDQFISRITLAVKDGVATIGGAERGRPLSKDVIDNALASRGRRIIDERDKARSGIQAISTNLTRVYDELDSDIDELKRILDNPPADQAQVKALLQRIADKWPTKMTLIEELAQNSLKQIGCPIQFASNP
jgi:predicted  nucleic acid-binding Zn-ribbon protein